MLQERRGEKSDRGLPGDILEGILCLTGGLGGRRRNRESGKTLEVGRERSAEKEKNQ